MKPPLLLLLAVAVNHELVHGQGSVKLIPDSTQFWEYEEQVSVSCEDFGHNWTVWRFTKSGDLSDCGSGWGTKARSSVCDLKTLKPHDSGLYWCESKYGDCSHGINLTVTGGSVILQSPVRVVSGQDVVLSCRFRSEPKGGVNVDFMRDGVLLKSGPDPQTTVRFSPDHQGAYSCRGQGQTSPPLHMFLPDETPAPVLVLSPDSEQVFEYSSVVFSCEPRTEGWSVRRHRNAQSGSKSGSVTGSQCGSDWGSLGAGELCVLSTIKRPDSALYWCGKNMRRSNSVQLQVKDRGVVLQIPVRPVSQGQSVSLACRHHADSALPARFYRDGHFLSEQETGGLTLQEVALSDEGQYHCEIRGEKSAPSWLHIRTVAPPEAEKQGLTFTLLHLRYLVVFAPYVASTVLVIAIYRQTGGSSVTQGRRRRRRVQIEPEYEDEIPDRSRSRRPVQIEPEYEDEIPDRSRSSRRVQIEPEYEDEIPDVTTEYQF